MSLESPLGKVRGLGSAKEGVEHWWWQRLTAIALVPLTLWFAWSAICLAGADYGAAREFFASPWRATLMIIFLGALLFHGQLGLQTVIEDYVHSGSRMFLLWRPCWRCSSSASAPESPSSSPGVRYLD